MKSEFHILSTTHYILSVHLYEHIHYKYVYGNFNRTSTSDYVTEIYREKAAYTLSCRSLRWLAKQRKEDEG